MKRKTIWIVSGVAAIGLIAGTWQLYHYIRGVSAEEVDSIIKSRVPIGSNTSDVIAFADSLKVGSLQVQNAGYRNFDLTLMGSGLFYIKDRELNGSAKGYLDVRILNTSRTYYLSECDMTVRFYFDKNDRLLDYQIVETFD